MKRSRSRFFQRVLKRARPCMSDEHFTVDGRFSRNSFDLICHCSKDDDFTSPIWTMDQCRTSANAAASSGNGPDSMKWLFPCTRMPTIGSQASRRGSATG